MTIIEHFDGRSLAALAATVAVHGGDPDGGRCAIRALLHMAALSAKTHNPKIRAFAQRLEAAGKPFHTVMTACIHKLIVILNSMVANNKPWSLSA